MELCPDRACSQLYLKRSDTLWKRNTRKISGFIGNFILVKFASRILGARNKHMLKDFCLPFSESVSIGPNYSHLLLHACTKLDVKKK